MAKNSLLRSYLLFSFLLSFSKSLPVSSSPFDLSLSINLPHHNIVCLPHPDRPFSPKKYQIQKPSSFLSRFTSSANPSPLLSSSPDRHIFFNTLPKPPFHNCSTDLELNSEPPFSLHISNRTHHANLPAKTPRTNQVVLPMQM